MDGTNVESLSKRHLSEISYAVQLYVGTQSEWRTLSLILNQTTRRLMKDLSQNMFLTGSEKKQVVIGVIIDCVRQACYDSPYSLQAILTPIETLLPDTIDAFYTSWKGKETYGPTMWTRVKAKIC